METLHHVNLEQLKELSAGNKDFEKKIINVFIKELQESMKDALVYSKKGEWESVYLIMHKIKPSLYVIEINELKDQVGQIEKYASQHIHTDELPFMVSKLALLSDEVIQDLNDTLDNYN